MQTTTGFQSNLTISLDNIFLFSHKSAMKWPLWKTLLDIEKLYKWRSDYKGGGLGFPAFDKMSNSHFAEFIENLQKWHFELKIEDALGAKEKSSENNWRLNQKFFRCVSISNTYRPTLMIWWVSWLVRHTFWDFHSVGVCWSTRVARWLTRVAKSQMVDG